MLGPTKAITRYVVVAGLCAMVIPWARAGELPGGNGKLDFGVEGLPIPEPLIENATSPRTVEFLIAAVNRQKAPFARAALIGELGRTRLPQALPPLLAALDAAEAQVRGSAAQAIAILAQDQYTSRAAREAVLKSAALSSKLSALLKDDSPVVRVAALRAMVMIQGDSSSVIATALASGDPDLQLAALGLASGEQAGKAVAQSYQSLGDSLKPQALIALGRCKVGSALPLIHAAAKAQDTATVVAACEAMKMTASSESAPVARALADSTQWTIVREAIRAYGACAASADCVSLALGKIQLDDLSVRQACVEVLGANLNPETVESLVRQLSTDCRPLYLAARTALISAKDDATREACANAAGALLFDPSPRRQEDGSYVLGRYRSPNQLERHIRLLKHDTSRTDWALVAQVAESLGLIGRQEARKPIADFVIAGDKLAQSKPNAAAAVNNAFVAAGRLGISETLPACAAVLGQNPLFSDAKRRVAAQFVIGAAGTPKSREVASLYGSFNTEMDGKLEAVKAIGNLKLSDGVGRLEQPFPSSETAQVRWMVQWAVARITGRPAQHPPVVVSWVAETTYKDTTQK